MILGASPEPRDFSHCAKSKVWKKEGSGYLAQPPLGTKSRCVSACSAQANWKRYLVVFKNLDELFQAGAFPLTHLQLFRSIAYLVTLMAVSAASRLDHFRLARHCSEQLTKVPRQLTPNFCVNP